MNENFIHKNYFEKAFPKFFLDSTNNESLMKNKNSKRNYIIHDNDRYIIQEIEQHRLKETDQFCIFRFQDLTYEIITLK